MVGWVWFDFDWVFVSDIQLSELQKAWLSIRPTKIIDYRKQAHLLTENIKAIELFLKERPCIIITSRGETSGVFEEITNIKRAWYFIGSTFFVHGSTYTNDAKWVSFEEFRYASIIHKAERINLLWLKVYVESSKYEAKALQRLLPKVTIYDIDTFYSLHKTWQH